MTGVVMIKSGWGLVSDGCWRLSRGSFDRPGRRPGAPRGERLATLGIASLIAALPVSAMAQQAPNTQIAPTREEIERAPAPPSVPPPPQLTVEGGIERAPCALAGEAYRSITFTVKAVEFADLKRVSPDMLRPAYADYVGTTQPIAVICEIRDRAATILRNAGYVAAVEVPEQTIADGTIRFQVLMAKLVGIRVRGDAGRSERTIAAYLERLTGKEVFNRYDAERYLLLAGDLPGYVVRLSLRSARAARGEVIGEVAVLRTPGQIDVNIQNFGSKDLGRFGGLVRGQFYGLTGLGDRTTIGFFSTADFDEQQTLQLGHDFRIGAEGLTISSHFTRAWANPDLGDERLDVKARTLLASIEASYPFLRSEATTLRAAGGIELINQSVRLNDISLTRDRLRVGYLRLAIEAVDPASLLRVGGFSAYEPRWRAAGSLELRQGLDLLDATEPCGPAFSRCQSLPTPSRLEGDPTGTLLRFQGLGEYRPVPSVTLSLGVRAQQSDDALLNFERFSAGNYTAGRGYDPGTLLGDRGIGLQAELRYGGLIPPALDAVALQPYLFFDYAHVWNEGRPNAADGRQNLSSLGGGLRAVYGNSGQFDVTLAVPLERAGLLAERPDPRLLVSFTTKLWPWSF